MNASSAFRVASPFGCSAISPLLQTDWQEAIPTRGRRANLSEGPRRCARRRAARRRGRRPRPAPARPRAAAPRPPGGRPPGYPRHAIGQQPAAREQPLRSYDHAVGSLIDVHDVAPLTGRDPEPAPLSDREAERATARPDHPPLRVDDLALAHQARDERPEEGGGGSVRDEAPVLPGR